MVVDEVDRVGGRVRVRGRVADAFDLIRQEVQLAAVAEEETAE
jgi:hypothetical protein